MPEWGSSANTEEVGHGPLLERVQTTRKYGSYGCAGLFRPFRKSSVDNTGEGVVLLFQNTVSVLPPVKVQTGFVPNAQQWFGRRTDSMQTGSWFLWRTHRRETRVLYDTFKAIHVFLKYRAHGFLTKEHKLHIQDLAWIRVSGFALEGSGVTAVLCSEKRARNSLPGKLSSGWGVHSFLIVQPIWTLMRSPS